MSDARVRGIDLAVMTARSLHIQVLLTAERMQGLGFAFAILPALRRLYSQREQLAPALSRHMAYFATHPILSGFVIGATARLEERRANGEPIGDGEVDTFKRSLASPLAALGDPLFWVTLRPFAGLVGVLGIACLPVEGMVGADLRLLLCPLLTLLTYNAVALPFRLFGVARGYASADQPGGLLRSLRLVEWNQAISRAGAVGYGALIALVALSLDLGSIRWGVDGRSRVAALTPLVLGAVIGYAGLRRWPGRGVEVGLGVLAAAAVFAATV